MSPEVFLATAARLIPRDVQLSIEQQHPGGLDASDSAILRAIKDSIPDAELKSPAEMLSYVAEAVRAHAATTMIEALSDVRLMVLARIIGLFSGVFGCDGRFGRATATLALRSPLRFAIRIPQAVDHLATRVSRTLAAS